MPSIFRPAVAGPLAALSLLVLLYSLIIAQQILLGVMLVIFIWVVYLFFLLVVTLGRIAQALERLVEVRQGPEHDD